MRGEIVATVLFLEHHATGAVEKLGPALGKFPGFLRDLAK